MIGLIGEDGGVDIAVTEMTEGRNVEAMARRDFFDVGDDLNETAPGHGDVLENGRRPYPRKGGKGAAPGRRESGGVGIVGRFLDGDGAIFPRDLGHRGGFLRDDNGMPIRFHEDNRGGSGGQADFGVGLDTGAGLAVEELEGAGNDLLFDDLRDGPRRCLHRVKGSKEGPARFGSRDELEEDLGDDAEGALGPDEEILHRVAGDVFNALRSEPGDLARGQNDLDAHDVVSGNAIFQSTQAARVVRDISSYRRDLHRAGIGRIKKPEGRGRIIDRLGDDAAFTEHRKIGRVDFEDAVEMDETENDPAFDGDAAARETGARTARDDGYFLRRRQFNNPRDGFGAARQDDTDGTLLQRGSAVETVGNEVFGAGEDVALPHDLREAEGDGAARGKIGGGILHTVSDAAPDVAAGARFHKTVMRRLRETGAVRE